MAEPAFVKSVYRIRIGVSRYGAQVRRTLRYTTPKGVTMPKKQTPADAILILTLDDLHREAEIRKARNW